MYVIERKVEAEEEGRGAFLDRSNGSSKTLLYQQDIAADSTTVTMPMEMLPTFEKTIPTFDSSGVEKRGIELC